MNEIESIQLNATSLHERELTVTVPSKLVGQEFSKTLNSVQRVSHHKGFRPGKMPKDMVMSIYGAEVKEKLIQKLIKDSFDFACKKEDIIPVSRPQWEPVGGIEQDKPFTYRAVFQVKPKVAPPTYKGLAIEFKKVIFNENDVLQEIVDLQEGMATFVTPAERKEIGDGDLVECKSIVSIDGVVYPQYSQDDYAIPMYADYIPADVKATMRGKGISDVVSIAHTMPSHIEDQDIAGKPCEMTLTILSFKERILPKMDDELAKDISDRFTTLDELKDTIRQRFTLTARHREEGLRQEAILKALVEKNALEVPEALVEQMTLTLINQELKALEKHVAAELLNKHLHELWPVMKERALFRVKANLLTEALVKDLEIDATDEEVAQRVKRKDKLTNEEAAYIIKIDKVLGAIEKDAIVTVVEEPFFKTSN